jgi:hypothetical protein
LSTGCIRPTGSSARQRCSMLKTQSTPNMHVRATLNLLSPKTVAASDCQQTQDLSAGIASGPTTQKVTDLNRTTIYLTLLLPGRSVPSGTRHQSGGCTLCSTRVRQPDWSVVVNVNPEHHQLEGKTRREPHADLWVPGRPCYVTNQETLTRSRRSAPATRGPTSMLSRPQ